MHSLKFLLFHCYALIGIAAFWFGGAWIVVGLVFTLFTTICGDLLLGDDVSQPRPRSKLFYNVLLWSAMPLLATLMWVAILQLKTVNSLQGTLIWLAGVLYVGLLIGTLGTVTAHELIHRKWGSFSHLLGRWLLAFSFDSNFAIEHVFGHHINIATRQDPASAPRGRTVYQHILLSTIQGNLSAWHIEKRRLSKQTPSPFALANRFLHGVLMSLVLLTLSYAIGGLSGVAFFALAGIVAKCLLESVNYMEHYGLVRIPGKRVFPRHSWNANNKISSWSMFNLTRHSHHHANANVPFQHLKSMPDAPLMPTGYLGTLGLTLLPSIWFRLMKPKLHHWDTHFASEEERQWLADNQ